METTIVKGNIKLEIRQDFDPQNPRSLDYTDCNMSKMICFHKRYCLGDEHDYDINDYPNWDFMEKDIIKNENPLVILPLYLYDHSGITISTKPFDCRWDSGQIGFIIVTKKEIKNTYDIKRCTKKWYDKGVRIIENEVKTYDDYLTGQVYGYTLYEDDNEVDSCCGFYGDDFWTNGISDNIGKNMIDVLRSELEKEFGVEKK
jgi:hypothetical protein